jgi:type I restriction enzyme S subunit
MGTESEWKRVRLGDLVEVKHGYAFEGQYFADDPTEDALVTPGNFNIGGGFNASKQKFYRGPVPPEFVLVPGDVIVTMTDLSKAADTLGYGAMIPAVPGKRLLHNQRIGRIRFKSNAIEPGFLHYVLRTSSYRNEIVGSASGSTVKHTSPSRIEACSISLPPLSEQRAIAMSLRSLDDKIDLNRRMNETLEAMARALFKSWFVDFDPVRAKREGRQPVGMDAETARLFPSEFQKSEVGEVPRGWTKRPLAELAHVQGGKQLASASMSEAGRYPVFGANGVMGMSSRSNADGFVIAFGRVGAYCGSLNWTYNGAWINNNATSIRPIQHDEFVLQSLIAVDFMPMRSGSAQPFIPNAALEQTPIWNPGEALAAAFSRTVQQFRIRQSAAMDESRTLASLRDTLLPRLLSGELRIRDAERLASP